MELRSRHWVLALAVAAVVHVGLAFLSFYEADEGAAQAVGMGGIEVSLGPAGGSPEAAIAAVEPELAEAETVTAAEAPVVEAELETALAEVAKVAEQPSAPIEEVRAREVKPPAPKPKPKPQPPAAKPKPPAPVQPQPEVARSEPSAPGGSGGRAGTQKQKEAGSGDATPGGGAPGATADYFAHLRVWLEKHKRYPRRAQLRRQEGTVLLRFVMDRQGRVLSYRVERSSGYRALDNEVEEMIERASPLPAMPAEIRQARLELVVPVSFFLR